MFCDLMVTFDMDVSETPQYEASLAFAETALGQIRALRQAATPRNFEIWYHYATGYNRVLNETINKALAEKGSLSEADLEHIYSTYIAPGRMTERIETVNSRVVGEIKQVLDMIDAAAGSATNYSESLADATVQLAGATDGETLRSIIECLIQGAKEMESNNKKLEESLAASKQEIEQLQRSLHALRAESFTDPLTVLSNRKFFDSALAEAVAEAERNGEPLSLLMADIDHFKHFNDKFGHLTGDQVLRVVAGSLKQNVKGQDIAARYGGEEFVIALPNTPLDAAVTVAQHIRRAVMAKELVKRSSGERLGYVTISIGAAALRPDDTPQTLIDRADTCLYTAKRLGRNRVICEADLQGAAGSAGPARTDATANVL